MTNLSLQRYIIPYEAAQLASQAVDQQGEFDAARCTVFPSLIVKQPLYGADLQAPSAWQAFIRVFSNGVSEVFQLYILAENTPDQGASRYDQAVLPGGIPLDVEHISMEHHPDRDRGQHSFWSQHLTVALDRRLLEDHLHAPLRVRVARPRDGMVFVVEIPAYYVAGVLYRCSPDAYDVAPQSIEQQQQEAKAHEQQMVLQVLKQSAWIGLAFAVVMLFFADFGTSLASGGCALMVAFHVLQKRNAGRASSRHYLRSPSD